MTQWLMRVRTTIEIPGALHDELRRRSEQTGLSIQSLVIAAIQQTYGGRDRRVTGPLVRGRGKLGTRFPVDENPHDVVFS